MDIELNIIERRGVVSARENGEIVGDLVFKIRDNGDIVITHTHVSDGYEGRGIGRTLVQYAAEYAMQHTVKIIPLCSFARSYIERNEKLRMLLAD
ncbi:MAG: N-acetyltransferase [Prevotella sp.]|nr:N-acetyltransferase [Prevotella sp.]